MPLERVQTGPPGAMASAAAVAANGSGTGKWVSNPAFADKSPAAHRGRRFKKVAERRPTGISRDILTRIKADEDEPSDSDDPDFVSGGGTGGGGAGRGHMHSPSVVSVTSVGTTASTDSAATHPGLKRVKSALSRKYSGEPTIRKAVSWADRSGRNLEHTREIPALPNSDSEDEPYSPYDYDEEDRGGGKGCCIVM